MNHKDIYKADSLKSDQTVTDSYYNQFKIGYTHDQFQIGSINQFKLVKNCNQYRIGRNTQYLIG